MVVPPKPMQKVSCKDLHVACGSPNDALKHVCQSQSPKSLQAEGIFQQLLVLSHVECIMKRK